MTEELTTCELTCPSSPEKTLDVVKSKPMDLEQPIFSVLSGGVKQQQPAEGDTAGTPAATTPDTESGIFSGECELCVEHESELDWFCGTEQRLICSHCAIVGPCHGHSVTPVATRVTAVRLQALRIERFIKQTLTAKEQKLQVGASRAREHILAQRAHWSKALANLTQTRSGLVHTLTHSSDAQLVTSVQEIAERVEAADGVGEPCDTEQLNMNSACSDSKLLRGLWATAVLLGPNAYGSFYLKFDQRTVSPLLSLSDDFYTLTFSNKKHRQPLPYDPARFDCWPNALGSLSMSSGTHSWVVDVGESGAFKVGVCYTSLERKGSGNEARLGYNSQSWVLSHYDGDYSFCHAGRKEPLQVARRPQRIGLLLDWPSGTLLFYEPDSSAVLHSFTHYFNAPLLPAFAVTDRSITILH
ncbi:B box and SPRY domain containing protein [Dissostichus eleginoides]|uniref:B box and SPRY domain containing protein n=1 Tax=Dissostichus eleginoides TaxID=100907 RepID=A0AAD9BJ38_DISEL|nr:B box and SPRY domain containing protein [Dissostichus eleginoides]